MPTRNMNLTDHYDQFIEEQVEAGKFKNASEVLREQDYRKMQEMIFGEAPEFERLLEVLREIERHVNGG